MTLGSVESHQSVFRANVHGLPVDQSGLVSPPGFFCGYYTRVALAGRSQLTWPVTASMQSVVMNQRSSWRAAIMST